MVLETMLGRGNGNAGATIRGGKHGEAREGGPNP